MHHPAVHRHRQRLATVMPVTHHVTSVTLMVMVMLLLLTTTATALTTAHSADDDVTAPRDGCPAPGDDVISRNASYR